MPNSRNPRRIEIPGPLTYFVGKKEFRGWILNANRAGVLIAAEREEQSGAPLLLRVSAIGGETFDLPARVARSAKKQTPVQGLGYALGLQFDGLTDAETERLGWVLESQQGKLRLPLELACQLLSAGDKVLGGAVVDEESDSPLLAFAGEITAFERRAYLGATPVDLLARELTLLRVQLGVFKALLPRIAKDPGGLALALVPPLEQLLVRLDRTELTTDETIRTLVDEENPENRMNLNELSTRLDEPKVDLFREIERKLQPLGSEAWKSVVADVTERLHRVRSARRRTDTDAGYHTPFVKKAVERSVPVMVRQSHRVVNSLLLGLAAAAIVVVFWLLATPHLRLAGYDLPLKSVTATIDDQTLIVRAHREEWKRLSAENREKTMDCIKDYMGKKRIMGAKILAEDETALAMVLSAMGEAGGKTQFTTHTFE